MSEDMRQQAAKRVESIRHAIQQLRSKLEAEVLLPRSEWHRTDLSLRRFKALDEGLADLVSGLVEKPADGSEGGQNGD